MSTFTRSTDRVAIGALWAVVVGILLGPPAGRAAVRSNEDIRPPDVSLIDSTGREVRLADLLAVDEPVLVQFVFTTCPGICPILAATFQSVRERLEHGGPGVRMLSISIDPEHDTPRVLAAFAETFRGAEAGAGDWVFLTGGHDEIVEVQKAFGAYREDKMSHEPLIFLRRGQGTVWIRFAGFASAEELARAVQSPPSGPLSPGGEG